MDANQLAEALSRAVELAKPAAEYCFLAKQDRWWTVCMTKAEWSGWMQAFGSVFALAVAIALPSIHARSANAKNFLMAKHCLMNHLGVLYAIRTGAETKSAREALLRSRETIATTLLAYGEVRMSDLPPAARPSWHHSRTSLEQVNKMVESLVNSAGSDDGMKILIGKHIDAAEKNFADFCKHDPNKMARQTR